MYAKLLEVVENQQIYVVEDEKSGWARWWGGEAYFRPMQARGPKLKGWCASLRSESNSGSPSQRSGMNSWGRLKYFSVWYMTTWEMETVVWVKHSVDKN